MSNEHITTSIKGLTQVEIQSLQLQFGKNKFEAEPQRRFLHIVLDVIKEPMFLLLVFASTLYFLLGETSEGILMVVAMSLVTAISLYQEVKSSKALETLQQLTAPGVIVIREGKEINILTEDLVPGDIILLAEGMKIPADAIVLQENDLTVSEAIITGESLPIEKHIEDGKNLLFQGTTVNSGKCIAKVTAIGNQTILGKLGKTIEAYSAPKTNLQIQINKFVRRLAIFGLVGFLAIFIVNLLHHNNVMTSLLFALTLAMSAVPEEIPVAFSSFMALGAFKMGKLGIISRQPQTIENLGGVSVICLDKTGTITENKMQVKSIFQFSTKTEIELNESSILNEKSVLLYGMLASEVQPFDAMEIAIDEAFKQFIKEDKRNNYTMVHEYPLQGKPPMMTHVFTSNNQTIVAGKGAVERIINICKLAATDREMVSQQANKMALKGYRVLGVANAFLIDQNFPEDSDNYNWQFQGLIALYDPPKQNINEVFKQFYDAGIKIKMVTGDYPETAISIGNQIGMLKIKCISGDQILTQTDEELQKTVNEFTIFARMFPEAKLKIINAIKANGDIVAITGDGVNDAPALKAADIGVAMGEKGTAIARQAADLIITDDDIDKIVVAIAEGRKIFNNLKKAIRYIISIHIPIVFTAVVPVLFGWIYPNIFTPIHIIFLEMIMGPTCSIFFENEPVEGDTMQQLPKERRLGIFRSDELLICIIQGLMISGGVLGLYYYFMKQGIPLEQVRGIVFNSLVISNILLTFVDRSFSQTLAKTIKYKNSYVKIILIVSVIFIVSLNTIPMLQQIFKIQPINNMQFLVCALVSFVSVMWFEGYKINYKLLFRD
jgi:Ca2+-transporting ATPase